MQDVSATYREILSGSNYWYECSLVIGDSGRLITRQNELILFGGTAILVDRGGGDAGFQENIVISIQTVRNVFAGSTPTVGGCVSGEITVELLAPSVDIPRMAELIPYVRICNPQKHSEWIQKGCYFIDTRETRDDGGNKVLTLHGYDAMLKTEADFPIGGVSAWPATDAEVIRAIANEIGVSVDERTWDIVTNDYMVQMPENYSMREVLGYIGAMYAGNWIMTDLGELQLIALNGLPGETNYLVDQVGYAIVFGGDRILV